MKMPVTVLLATAFAALVLSPLSVSRAEAPKEIILINFADIRRDPDGQVFHAYEYTYEEWGNKQVIDLTGRGILIQAPSGRGGLGENRTMARFHHTPAVMLTYLIGNDNEATSITFALTDSDGTELQWNVPLENRPKGRPLQHRIELGQPDSEVKPGKKPGLDPKKVHSWQVRGNYSAPKVEVLLIKLVAAS